MLNNIFTILDKLGFDTQKRAINVHFSNAELNSQIMIQRIDGYHGINEGLSAEIVCLSTNPYIELKQFIGCQVAVDQVTDSGRLFRTTGIITGASQGQSDGAFSLYRLTLQDATSLWHKRRNSRVFMNKSVVDIIGVIFKEWQTKSALFASGLKLDTSGLTKTYDVRPFSMQSNETDYSFLTRIMREESINWLVDESSYIVSSNSQNIEAQKFRLIDHNAQFKSLDRRVIRYHRSNATEQYDSITSFIAQRNLQPTAIHVQRWQADNLSQEDASGSVLSSHKHSSQRDNESLSLEQAWNLSPAWIRDLKGEDQATASSNTQLEKLNKHLNQYQALQSKFFTAHSSVRDTQVGYWFQLTDHPELEKNHNGSDKEFLILNKHFYNQNNLPKDIKIQDGNIEIACPGQIDLKAGLIKTNSGTSLSSQLPAMPELKANYDEHFILHYPDGAPAKNLKYKITADDGQIFEGISGEDGKTSVCNKDAMAALKIEVFSPE